MTASLHIATPVTPTAHYSDAITRIVVDLGPFGALHLDIATASTLRDQLDSALAQETTR